MNEIQCLKQLIGIVQGSFYLKIQRRLRLSINYVVKTRSLAKLHHNINVLCSIKTPINPNNPFVPQFVLSINLPPNPVHHIHFSGTFDRNDFKSNLLFGPNFNRTENPRKRTLSNFHQISETLQTPLILIHYIKITTIIKI